MKIESVRIDEIEPYRNNVKLHPASQIEQIKNSILTFGNNDPIAIDEKNIIIEGHGRLLALKELGYSEVEVIRLPHLTEEQRRAYSLIHNQLTMNTGFDLDMLKIELAEIVDVDMVQFDFDYDFLEESKDVQEDEFEIELPPEPKTKLGDIFELGKHRLMCGDSTNVEEMKMLMNGLKADLFLTDPPYNVNLGSSGSYDEARKRHMRKDGITIMNDKMEDAQFRNFLISAFGAAKEVMKLGASFYIWHADSEGYNFRGACLDNDWKIRQTLIWKKNAITLGRQDYQWKHEPCLYGWNNGSHNWYSDRKQSTILEYDRPSKSPEHPTMKPVMLFDYQIKNSTKVGDIVLDSFAGSGTTLVACEQNGRVSESMELDPRFCDVIIERWERLTGEKHYKLT